MAAVRGIRAGALVAVLANAAPAHGDVIAQGQPGFVSRNVIVIAGTPAAVWKRLISPSAWWSGEHTFSGDAANLSLDPVPGGCFCEKLPGDAADVPRPARPGGTPRPPARGGVEHMRVVFVDRAKALRMVGALGPLQSEAVSATLTVTLKPVEGGTRVIFEYVVGGYMRYPPDKIAPAVDAVMADQLIGLARLFGPVAQSGATLQPPADSVVPPVSPGKGLDRQGLLLPRGKVWSLPANGPALPPPAEPAPAVAPLPTAPLPPDVSVQDGTRAAVQPAAEGAPPVALPDLAAEASAAPPKPRPKAKAPAKKPAPKPAAKAVPKTVAGPEPKPAATSGEPSRAEIDSALDAAFPAPPPPPQ